MKGLYMLSGLIIASIFIVLLSLLIAYLFMKIADITLKRKIKRRINNIAHLKKVFARIEKRKLKEKERQERKREETWTYLSHKYKLERDKILDKS